MAVDSSQVDKGTLSLTKMAGAARQAEAATKGVTTGARGAASAAAAVVGSSDSAAGALTREAAAARNASAAMRGHSIAVNDNARRMGGSFSGLAAQVQDIGVTAAMGMNPMLIALQQGTQIAGAMEMAMQGGSSVAGVFGAALKSLISPVSILSIGLTALLAAGLQMVDWPKLAASALKLMADVLDTIAPYAIGAAAGLALLYAPAILSGLATAVMSLGTVATAVWGIATAIYATVGLPVLLVAGFTAMVAAAVVFRDELTSILGVDIVGAAKAGVNYIIGSFVAAYQDIKFVWQQLPNVVGAAAVGATNAVVSAIQSMINGAASLLNDFIDTANKALAALPGGLNIGKVGTVDLPKMDNPYADALAGAVGQRNNAVEKALSTDYLGGFGADIANGASAASGKLKELADWLGKVDEKKKKHRGKTEAEKYSDVVDVANRRIASLQSEYDALGMTDMAAAKLAYETDLLNQAQQKGITLSAAQKAELSDLAGRMAALEIATQKAREAMDFAKDLTKGFITDLRSGLEQGKSFWESFGNAALNVLDKITDKLLDDVLNAIFKVNSASSSGGGFWGALGSLFGMGGGGGFTAFETAFTGLPGLWANGGYTGAGGKYEPAGVVHRGEYVFSAAATRALGVTNLDRVHRRAKGYAGGGYVDDGAPRLFPSANQNSASSVHVTVGVSVDKNGNLMPFVESVSERKAGQAVATYRGSQAMTQDVAAHYEKGRSNRMIRNAS